MNMDYINQRLLITKMIMTLFSITILLSCKKDEVKTVPLTSLTIGNFKISGKSVKFGSNTTSSIANNNTNGTQFAMIAGTNDLYFWPLGDSLHPYYVQNKFVTQEGEVYSIFLCGDTLTQRGDAVIIKEIIPYRTDSTAGIRFINLSPNSTPLNITLSTSSTVNEVTGLVYKSYTDFKSYPAVYNSAYTFQVRKADGTLLTTFALTASTVPRFANITVVIRGQITGSPVIGTTRVNHDR